MKPDRPNCPTPRKLCFDNEQKATQALRYMHHSERTFKPARVYLCECKFWHFASNPVAYTTKPEESR